MGGDSWCAGWADVTGVVGVPRASRRSVGDVPDTFDPGANAAPAPQASRLRQVAIYFGLADEDPDAKHPEGPSEPTLTGWRVIALSLVPATAFMLPMTLVGTTGGLIWVGVVWLAALAVVSPLGAALRPRYPELNETTAFIAMVLSMLAVWDDARWWTIASFAGLVLVTRVARPWLVRREMDHRSRRTRLGGER